MPQSQALRDFKSALGLAKALATREKRFQDPPKPTQVKVVQGLRGGAMVLMVAAFENFLRELIEERLYELTLHPPRFNSTKIPEEMVYHNMRQTLDRALRGPFPAGVNTKMDKSSLMRTASQIVVLGVVNTEAFSQMARSNPNSKKVRELFKSLGIADIFSKIKPEFDKRWTVPTAHTFLPDKLDEILDRRHEVAHTARVLNVSRADMAQAIAFLVLFATLCDLEMERHVRYLLS